MASTPINSIFNYFLVISELNLLQNLMKPHREQAILAEGDLTLTFPVITGFVGSPTLATLHNPKQVKIVGPACLASPSLKLKAGEVLEIGLEPLGLVTIYSPEKLVLSADHIIIGPYVRLAIPSIGINQIALDCLKLTVVKLNQDPNFYDCIIKSAPAKLTVEIIHLDSPANKRKNPEA